VAFAAKWADPFSGARAVALFDLALPPVLLNPGDNSNGFGTTLRNLQLLVYGASLGNGVFRQSDFDHMVLSTDLAVDVSAEWVGQPQQNDARWGRTPGGGGPMLRIGPSEPDFNLFLLTPGAPNGTWYFQLTTNSGRSETIRLTSFAPLPAPGACCAVSGACTLSPDPVCLFNGGTPLAAGTVCAPNPCTRQGRCCNFVTGSCSMAYLNACGAAAHTWTPQGACSPNPCAPVGSCCIDGAACRRLAQSLCVSFDGAWSLGGVCTPSPCMSPAALAVTPCPADFNHSGSVDAADMFDFLNAWFAADQRADFNGEGRTSVLVLLDFTNAWLHGCAENSPPVSTIPAEARRSGYPPVHPRD
jgi:hypothetical protein